MSVTTQPVQSSTMYDWIGGAKGLQALVTRFYEIIDTDPDATVIRAMHQADLSQVRQSLFEWLSGWLGGPPLFVQKNGGPCINAAHKPFHIDEAARDQWLDCMGQSMIDVGVDEKYREMLEPALFRVADSLVNARG